MPVAKAEIDQLELRILVPALENKIFESVDLWFDSTVNIRAANE